MCLTVLKKVYCLYKLREVDIIAWTDSNPHTRFIQAQVTDTKVKETDRQQVSICT